ncbi:Uncharacterized protein BP5553_03603 [Venustampulla echinocandica]|uniref:Uncharacterized protein n=1 Tax=Venustampulla echinocandica TaxID=2656787 RepID=A0A370TUQ1_9HELO|nr:Uncharacterized protein BP5553_03603 [Venustampulla echinocandica]RDL39263.1 Uncharacterized protein BP5553_03603 [Venustampulla echinocandica]
MSFASQSSSPSKRPRLSLQIKTPATAVTFGKSSTALKVDVDPSSPTAFNTLSNAYAVAIENASPRTARPISADIKCPKPTALRLETKNFSGSNEYIHPSQRTQTPGPFTITYPDTPSSAHPGCTPTSGPTSGPTEPKATATSFTFTPPQSAGSIDQSLSRIFTFDTEPNKQSLSTPRTPRRRATIGSQYQVAPYTHPRSLHSILRNSPLPPRSTVTPATPSRVSLRLANRAKKVGYNDPLTQTITTNKYIKSHIDLLAEDSPYSATDPEMEKPEMLDLALIQTAETRDGGQTPGPFEEMRRRMADSDLETPGTRKRKRKEKKRKWEWTISSPEAEGEQTKTEANKTPVTAFMVEKTPSTAVIRAASESTDSEMSEPEERFVPSVGPSTDSEMSDSDQRPGTSQSL